MTFQLLCQPCGKSVVIDGPNPTSAIDIMAAAEAAGWLCCQNNIAHGVVIFCSYKCRNAALTKSGFFRRDLGRGRMRSYSQANVSTQRDSDNG